MSEADGTTEQGKGGHGKRSARRRFLRGLLVLGGLGVLVGAGGVGHFLATMYRPREDPRSGADSP